MFEKFSFVVRRSKNKNKRRPSAQGKYIGGFSAMGKFYLGRRETATKKVSAVDVLSRDDNPCVSTPLSAVDLRPNTYFLRLIFFLIT